MTNQPFDHIVYPVVVEDDLLKEQTVDLFDGNWTKVQTILNKTTVNNIQDFASCINQYTKSETTADLFIGLSHYLTNVIDKPKQEKIFTCIIPFIKDLATKLPSPTFPLLKQGQSRAISLKRRHVASILANAFFCTFPDTPSTRPLTSFPQINFEMLYMRPSSTSMVGKLDCIFQYFETLLDHDNNNNDIDDSFITFERRHVNNLPEIINKTLTTTTTRATRVRVESEGRIEDCSIPASHVDFANKFLGGGALDRGCVQEEILFMISPELIVSGLLCEKMSESEAIYIIGAKRYSNYNGYGYSFQFAGPSSNQLSSTSSSLLLLQQHQHQPKKEFIGHHRLMSEVIAIDAYCFPGYNINMQFEKKFIEREVWKSYVGFLKPILSCFDDDQKTIATGNWGCGAFRGDLELKFVIQVIAAALADRDLVYYTFGKEEFAKSCIRILGKLKSGLSIQGLYRLTLEYRPGGKLSLFDYILL